MKIVLASNNAGKLAELNALFAPLGVTLIRQSELGIPEAEEPYKTFVENALAKARNAAQHSGLPAIADDAGLCVDAFGGLPGVDTAYYATQFGYPKSDTNNVRALLEQMQAIDNRRAALVSTLVAVRAPQDPEPLIAVGRAIGEITRGCGRVAVGGDLRPSTDRIMEAVSRAVADRNAEPVATGQGRHARAGGESMAGLLGAA